MKRSDNQLKSTLKVLAIIIFSVLSNMYSATAQDSDYNKNSVFINYGNIFYSSQVSFAYERTIYQKGNLRTRAKINYGIYLSNESDSDKPYKVYENHAGVSGVFLYRLLEVNIGAAFTKYTEEGGQNRDYNENFEGIVKYFNVGIRYEKEDFTLRAGIGNLELLYVGVGFNF